MNLNTLSEMGLSELEAVKAACDHELAKRFQKFQVGHVVKIVSINPQVDRLGIFSTLVGLFGIVTGVEITTHPNVKVYAVAIKGQSSDLKFMSGELQYAASRLPGSQLPYLQGKGGELKKLPRWRPVNDHMVVDKRPGEHYPHYYND